MKLIAAQNGNYYDYEISYSMTKDTFRNVCRFSDGGARFRVDHSDVVLHDSNEYLLLVSNDVYFIYISRAYDLIPPDAIELVQQHKALMDF